MNLFQLATAGVDVGSLPDQDAPRAPIDFGASAAPQGKFAAPQELESLFDAAASEYGVDPTILKGIAFAESRFRPDIISGKVTSPAGAVGLMQFMPATAKEMGINPLDPAEAVFGAAAYLRQSLDKFDGDVEKAVASYNFGRNRDLYTRPDWYKGLPAETRNYVGTVLEFADGLQAPAAESAPQHGIQIPLADGVQPSAAGAGRGTLDDPRRLDNPANQPQKPFLSQVADSAAGLVKTAAASNPVLGRFLKIAGGPQDKPIGSVLIDQPVVVGGANPNDMAENERLSRRDYAEQVEQRQRLANSQQMREPVAPTGAQAYAEANPIKAALKGDAARTLAGALNAPSVLVGLGAESVNRAATDAGGAPVFDRVPNMPLVDDLRKVTQDYASQLARRSPGQAWDNGEFGRWMMTQMAGNSMSAAQSLSALMLPGAQATLLGSMGAVAAGSAYGDGDTAGAAALKGLVEIGSEKLPLHAAEKVKDLVLAIPASARNQVLTEAGKRLLAAGTAISANSLVGAIEESAAKIGGNAIDKYVSGKNKSLFEDVDRAALVGAAFGGGMSAPAVAATMGTPQGLAARELAGALQADLPEAGGTVADMLRTEQNSTAQIAPEATSLAAADAEVARLQSVPQVQDQPTTPQAPVVVQSQQMAEVPVQSSVAPAVPEQSQAEQAVENIGALMDAAPKSELTAQPADVARQVLASEAGATAASVPTAEQAEQQLATREAPVEMQMRPTGTLLVKGDVPALRARLAAAGVDNTIAVDGGLVVARSQAAKAQEVLSTSTVAPMPTAQPAVYALQEAANVPQAQEPAAQPAAEAAQAAAPDITSTVEPVPAVGVSEPGAGSAQPQADGMNGKLEQKQAAIAPQSNATYSEGMTPELARMMVAKGRPPGYATKDTVRSAVNELVNGMGMVPNGLGRVVVATSDEIKTDWEPLIGATGMESSGDVGKAQGFYDPKTKTVFVIADHIRKGDELGVVAHELMHKHGQAVLGADGWNKLHTVIGTWANADQATMERRVYDEARARVESSRPEGAPEQQYSSQELFPYAVQAAIEAGVKPSLTAPQGTVARWLGQVRTALRQVWGKVTGKPGQFEAQDLVNLAFGIAQRENPAQRGELDGVVQNDGAPQTDSATDGEMQFSRSPIESSMGEMTPAQLAAWQKAAGLKTPPTLKERAAQMKANLSTKLRQGVVDQFAPIADLDQHAYMLARLSKGADGTMEAALLYGRPFLRDGVPDVDVNEGGFARVLAGLKGEHDRFLWWVAALRAENLKAQGKENLLDTPDIDALKTLNQGQMADGSSREMTYAEGLLELNDFNNAVLQIAKESGLIDQAAVDLFKDQPYVPFYRLQDESGQMQGPRFSAGLTNQQAWKKLKGGTQQINADLLQNMLMNWSSLYQAAARNRAALATMDAAEQLAVAYQVPEGTKGAVKIMRDGVAEHWAVEDPFLLEAISALHYAPSPLMKVLSKPKQLLTWGVTINPTFKIRNLIRDSVSAIAQADLSYNAFANVGKGWRLTASDSQIYASMLASGGVIKFGTQENSDRLRAQVAKLGGTLLDAPAWEKLLTLSKKAYDVYNEIGDRTENVNRTALYDRLIQKGHSHAEASFMARDLMDFSMGGNWPIVRFLTQTVPFLNARLQGLYKLGRAAGEDPARFAAVVGAVSLASLALFAVYRDDDDWRRREDHDRDGFWWFKIGQQAYRIPKPFEVGALGTIAERTAELMLSKEMDAKRFGERLRHMLASTFALDPIPQAIKPLLDVAANKDSFTGRAIETQADQRMRPQDRYGERTPEIAKLLGSWGMPDPLRLVKGDYAQLSPKQVEFLLRGYFSWVATVGFTMSDMVVRPLSDRGEKPDMRLKDVFLAGNFVETLPTNGSRYVSKMYDQARDAEQAYASYQAAVKQADHAKALEIRTADLAKLKSRERLREGTQALTRLNAQARAIEADKKLSGTEKRRRLDALDHKRHEIAKVVTSSPGQ